jgi:hypothetical protein
LPPEKVALSFLIGSYFRKRRFHDFGYPSVCVREQVTIYPQRDCRSSIDLSTPYSAETIRMNGGDAREVRTWITQPDGGNLSIDHGSP